MVSATTKSITQVTSPAWMREAPEIEEVRKPVEMLCDGKATGADGIHHEIIKRSETANQNQHQTPGKKNIEWGQARMCSRTDTVLLIPHCDSNTCI